MSFPKILVSLILVLFGSIFVVSLFKKEKEETEQSVTEIVLESIEVEVIEEVFEPVAEMDLSEEVEEVIEPVVQVPEEPLPDANRIAEFFNRREPRLPIVETITYKSQVPWLKGRPAWLSDYSSHYKTSRHFIARSLNGGPNYDKQEVKNGDRFNVLKKDANFEFYLLIDLTLSKMWFYFIDQDKNERVLVKTYPVGIGRPDPNSASGYLTPTGKYSLGDKIAVYRPKTKGFYQGDNVEMIRVFGTRWIPFGEEIADCTEPAKGLGIHGLPLKEDGQGKLIENIDSLGRYESDGCIRMATKDIEELFSIIITHPTTIELVQHFHQAKPPGKEKI